VDQVLVTGEQPGPGLWKVHKGDHTLWILGTLTPLPEKMTWRSAEVETVISHSQVVLAAPEIKAEIGFFRALTLVPSLLKARKNPDGAELKEVLPPDLYARWSTLKTKYIGNDDSIEKWRPMFAAQKLYVAAVEKSNLSTKDVGWPLVRKTAKKYDVEISTGRVGIPVEDPKGAIKDFATTSRELDIACMKATLDRLESDLGAMRARANAWAVGDVSQLRDLPTPKQYKACLAAFSSTPRLDKIANKALDDVMNDWLTRAMTALDKNPSSLAVVPVAEIYADEGRIARLRALGYEIEEPTN
jgi:uncharacterized protein YbaP (TraB family)